MSDPKKFISAAVLTGLAASAGHAATSPSFTEFANEPLNGELEFVIFGGAASDATSDNIVSEIVSEIDEEGGLIDLNIGLDIDEAVHGDETEADYYLAQTLYGGGGGTDGIISGKDRKVKPVPGISVQKPGKTLQPRKPKNIKPGKLKQN